MKLSAFSPEAYSLSKMLQCDVDMGVQVGQDLEEIYWRPGNGTAFLDLVQQLTGEALTADAWVSKLKESVSSVVQQEEQEYKEAVQQGPKIKPGDDQQICHPAQFFVHVQQGFKWGTSTHVGQGAMGNYVQALQPILRKPFDKKLHKKLDSHWFLLWLTFKSIILIG